MHRDRERVVRRISVAGVIDVGDEGIVTRRARRPAGVQCQRFLLDVGEVDHRIAAHRPGQVHLDAAQVIQTEVRHLDLNRQRAAEGKRQLIAIIEPDEAEHAGVERSGRSDQSIDAELREVAGDPRHVLGHRILRGRLDATVIVAVVGEKEAREVRGVIERRGRAGHLGHRGVRIEVGDVPRVVPIEAVVRHVVPGLEGVDQRSVVLDP